MKEFQIYEVPKNEQPELAFETECSSVQECIDEFIGMFDLFDKEDITEKEEMLISKLQNGEYEVQEDDEVAFINVYTY